MRALCLALLASLALATPAAASVVARVDNARQVMHVYVNGRLAHAWPVSTARAGYRTPAGSYGIGRMERMWHSRLYNMSPMPYSMFFRGGYAIHGTSATRLLGRRASHGCVRLATGNARTLFDLVQRNGGGRVVIVN